MNVRQRAFGHPFAVAQQIERSGNELPQLIPEKREIEVRPMNDEQKSGEAERKNRDACAFGLHALLNDRAGRGGLQLDLAESAFVLLDVLVQDVG